MQIISRRERKTSISYTRYFERRNDHGAGFMFECNEKGELLKPSPTLLESFRECQDGTLDVIDRGIQERERSWTEPSIGRCEDCGREVALTGFTNTCECGADYNMSGSRLAPRSQWGEETGESISDIMMADTDRAFED